MEPLTRKIEGLRHYLDADLPKGLAFLVQAHRTLSAYADVGAPAAAPEGKEVHEIHERHEKKAWLNTRPAPLLLCLSGISWMTFNAALTDTSWH
jgi:hypothetical protein